MTGSHEEEHLILHLLEGMIGSVCAVQVFTVLQSLEQFSASVKQSC